MLKSLQPLQENSLFRDNPPIFLPFQLSSLTEIQEILIYHRHVLIIFRYPQVLKSMVNEQIQAHPIRTNGTTKNVGAMRATILHHELRERFPANDRQQYSPNGTLAYHLIYTVLCRLIKRYQKLLHHG